MTLRKSQTTDNSKKCSKYTFQYYNNAKVQQKGVPIRRLTLKTHYATLDLQIDKYRGSIITYRV